MGIKAKRTALLAATTMALGLGGVLTATPASAAVILGGIDVAQQCRVQDWRPLDAWLLDANNAYSWRCHSPYTGNLYNVDMGNACARQYGGGAFSVLLNASDPYSWRCAR
ncbi:hypothetical protein [Umezawaea sp. Da 62-37]|uniref:hypothetical protein n=1 Tax=Umezawaea sp. Da 62-37 TaxID=3075927 RepID=UPI0028F73609|nr:hypothetical protein [Umezawaea sp. Da 62-37]WNV86815.1 hypothetical protein RM788_00570 [Umezawaea sp. Da 62-37]